MKRLIFGKGKVSRVIKKDQDVVLSKSDCNILDASKVKALIDKFKPDAVINCAAKTNLEYCEENKIEAYQSNVVGVTNLLSACSDKNVKFIHISSGCLFDGNNFIADEKTEASPAVWYTWTKKWADELISNFGYENHLILRPRQLISVIPHKSNMLTKFASMKKISAIDELNSLTCIEDFSEMIDHLIKTKSSGIFNCCNTGTITPYDIAISVKKFINPDLVVERISYTNLLKRLPNKRVNTILSSEKIIKTGYTPRSSKEALEWCVKNYGKK